MLESDKKGIFTDSSARALLFSNLITIAFAILEKWSFYQVMWIYLWQSVIIGIFNAARIRTFITRKNAETPQDTKIVTWITYLIPGFFLLHYGFFHVLYAVMLLTFFKIAAGSITVGTILGINENVFFIGLNTIIFFINHLFSFKKNVEEDSKNILKIGVLMMLPYKRILPMHLTIIFGAIILIFTKSGMLVTIFFLLLKTWADLLMHKKEHEYLRKQ